MLSEFYWVSGDIKINVTAKLADWMHAKQCSEGKGAGNIIPELGVPVPVEESPCWAGGHWVGIGEACRNEGPPRKQAQATNLNGFWEMKRGKRYTERAVAQDGAGGSPEISCTARAMVYQLTGSLCIQLASVLSADPTRWGKLSGCFVGKP